MVATSARQTTGGSRARLVGGTCDKEHPLSTPSNGTKVRPGGMDTRISQPGAVCPPRALELGMGGGLWEERPRQVNLSADQAQKGKGVQL